MEQIYLDRAEDRRYLPRGDSHCFPPNPAEIGADLEGGAGGGAMELVGLELGWREEEKGEEGGRGLAV